MKKNNKYRASFANVIKGKSATYNFEAYGFKTLKAYAEMSLKYASVPVMLNGGWRSYDNVTEIYDWLRFDCDVEGEKETICSILRSNGLAYVALPSTNYDKKLKSYKWHISVPTKRTAQDVEQYKKQCRQALATLGIDLHDIRVSEICVQNMNPYKNGKAVKKGLTVMEVNEGESFKFDKPDKRIQYSAMSKTIYNGKGSDEVINLSVHSVKGSMTKLNSDSGIRIGKVGWTTLGALNLEAGGIIGDLSCPAHNTKHDNGRGAHKCGYAFATMDEGGDVWITCTGAECKGKYYMMEQESFGAHTKLTDLYELRRQVSLSGFDFKSSTVSYINANDVLTSFRDRDILNHWGESMFFKLNTTPNDDLQAKIDKLMRRKLKELGEMTSDESSAKEVLMNSNDAHRADELLELHGSYREALRVISAESAIQFEVDKLKSEHAWKVIEDAIGNKYQYSEFRSKYANHPNSYMGYVDDVVSNVLRNIRTHRQYSEIVYKVEPYQAKTTGSISDGKFVISFAKLTSERKFGKINEAIIADYKKHNKFLDDIIDMIMCQRFGADKKSSYLWIRADSNWGKSFLFDGIFGNLSYEVSADEIKRAIKGEPSGLDVNAMVKSSCLFVDEFKGAVSELKNISHHITLSPKNRGKYTVEINMKIFASAEQVQSLRTSSGAMESQFANRFLYMEAEGDLIKRKMYRENPKAYFKAVQLYVNGKINRIAEEYRFYGEAEGSRKANDRYNELIAEYSIKNDSHELIDDLPIKFREWLIEVKRRENISDNSMRHTMSESGMIIFHKDGKAVTLLNVTKLKDVFMKEYIADAERGMVNHKMPHDIMGYTANKRTNIRFGGVRYNGYRLEL